MPHLYQVHLWKIAHDRLLTNARRSVWSSESPNCPGYGGMQESVLHAIKNCPLATQIWIPLIPSSNSRNFFDLNLSDWVKENLSHSFGFCDQEYWSYIFATACYLIWQWRN